MRRFRARPAYIRCSIESFGTAGGKERTTLSLTIRELWIGASARQALERNPWSERYVEGNLREDGEWAPVGVRYRGGHTRNYPKRSYEIIKRGLVTHYNAEYDDPSMIRNALSFSFFNRIGVPAPDTRHVKLVVNGEPAGVYLAIEAVGRRFFERRGLGAAALFYAVSEYADFGLYAPGSGERKSSLLAGYEHRFGGGKEKARLASFIRGANAERETAAFRQAMASLDVDNYIRWLAGAVLTGNYDGFEQNYAIYRGGRTGKYRIVPWDYEGTWGRNCYGKPVDGNLVSVSGYNRLTRVLLAQRGVRARYDRLLRRLLDGPFTERALMPRVEAMTSMLAPAIREDVARKSPYREFAAEPKRIRDYIRERRAGVIAALEASASRT